MGKTVAPAKVYVVGNAGANPDNVVAAQKYMEKGFPIFLAHVTAKEVEDKSGEEANLRDMYQLFKTFLKYFQRTYSGTSSTATMEYQIEFVPVAASV
ncbi:hypothetical protein Tco_1501198 [Tanacetum coccineum]